MNALLDQFANEGRELLEAIGAKLLELERSPDDAALMDELFRSVHTLKGNSGLFELPEMTRVLHASEDLLNAVRERRLAFSRALADQLLEAMDFVGMLLDELEAELDQIPDTSRHAADATRLGNALSALMQTTATGAAAPNSAPSSDSDARPGANPEPASGDRPSTESGATRTAEAIAIPESVRATLYQELLAGATYSLLIYEPDEQCFFKGEDPFFQVSQLPAPRWRRLSARDPWPPLVGLDPYRCLLRFELILPLGAEALVEHFRYMPDEVRIESLDADTLSRPTTAASNRSTALVATPNSSPEANAGSNAEGNVGATPRTIPDATPEATDSFQQVIQAQRSILALEDEPEWLLGRLRAVAASLTNAFAGLGAAIDNDGLDRALATALDRYDPTPLRDWLAAQTLPIPVPAECESPEDLGGEPVADGSMPAATAGRDALAAAAPQEEPIRFGRRAEDQPSSRMLKVDQGKIDRMMNLVGEMIVAKNALPYLAARAETVHGVRELAREIKGQYGVINRIAEEMQDAMMQVRLLPVSYIFQRFPRLVRDIAHKLGKEVDLVMTGESTEADKDIIEALADPLIHIVRNSLDHGLEEADERERLGKPRAGRLHISARSLSDRVVIGISDDGRGIDPNAVRRKAYERGLIDEVALERLDDQEALNLVFAAGFSTARAITDLSGRGVGMDVVRNAIARVNGAIDLRSQVGEGTELRLSLPLSMAVTNVMIIESAGQRFGIPMDAVAETVRVPRGQIRNIKRHQTTVLRGRLVPLVALNNLLALDAAPVANEDDELAVLVARIDHEEMGIIVDDCRETVDIILKPMEGVMASIPGYAGSALLGDGSVLLVLNPMELL